MPRLLATIVALGLAAAITGMGSAAAQAHDEECVRELWDLPIEATELPDGWVFWDLRPIAR